MITPPGAGVKDKKRAILEATLAVLRERGLSGLKMEEVARRAEVGKGTIYLYFRDKRDLLKALVEERTAAKKAKDWARADAIRARLTELGWSVADTAKGPQLSKL